MREKGRTPQGGIGKKKSHRVSNTILVLILLAGVAIAGYPAFSDYWNSMHQTRAIQGYAERIAELDNEEYIAIWESALDYNRRLAEDPNPWAMSDEDIDDYERQLNVDGTGNMGFISTYKEEITQYINEKQPVVISVNFVPTDYLCDFGFFSNNKRFSKIDKFPCQVIATSNLSAEQIDFHINYNRLSGSFEQGCNSLLMLLTLLKDMNVQDVSIAGADGYAIGGKNYYRNDLRTYTEHGHNFNVSVAKAIRKMELPVTFITPSAYDITEE